MQCSVTRWPPATGGSFGFVGVRYGFGGIAASAAGIAKILFVIFLVIAIIALFAGRGRTPPA